MKKYADVLIWGMKRARKGSYRKGDIILIRFDLPAIKMAEILQGKVLEMGMNPIMRLGLTPHMEENFYKTSDKLQLRFLGPWEEAFCHNLNGSIYLHAPESLTHLSHIDPKKIGEAIIARKPLRDVLRKREEMGAYGWTLCTFPTNELAKQARLPYKKYVNQVIRACYLDKADPVKAWQTIYNKAVKMKKWLNRMDVEYYRIQSKDMDLKITSGIKRNWIGISGHNIPSFEIFLSPDWRGTEGTYYADQPSFRNGNYVGGIRLSFKKGVVVKMTARKGSAFAEKQIAMDKGASRVGEFSLTDKRFSRINTFMANTLYDENYGGAYGNCHLALGASYSDTYAGDPAKLDEKTRNRLGFNDSALHWDLVNTQQKRVTAHLASGEKRIIYEDGLFRYS